jgi:hypothetical protein
LFENYTEQTRIHCFSAERQDYQLFEAGLAKMAVGRVKLTSEVTRESSVLNFGVLHMGDHNVNGGMREFSGEHDYQALAREAVAPFMRADFAEVIRLMDRRFGESNYSLRSLFRDEQRKILDEILASALRETEVLYRQIYEHRAPMMRFLTNLRIPLPKAFYAAAEFVLNGNLRRALEQEEIDAERVHTLLETAQLEGVSLDTATLEFAFRHNLERMAERVVADPTLDSLQQLDQATSLIRALPFSVDLWKIQNAYYRLLEDTYPKIRRRKERGDELAPQQQEALRTFSRSFHDAQTWIECFQALGGKLGVKLM